jgi:hypothetical protein
VVLLSKLYHMTLDSTFKMANQPLQFLKQSIICMILQARK